MIIKIKNLNINYTQFGEGKDIILLHGWGQNIEMMEPIGKRLNGYKITILDFPGFGKSDSLKEAWNIYDYNDFLEEFLNKLNIVNPIIIAHSFGGRVAIVYASKNKVEKLVLFGSPCIRSNKKSLKVTLKVALFKMFKKIPGTKKIVEELKNHIGSEDYRNASPILRDTLVKVVNEDLGNCAINIFCPTLLIWGTNDTAAPIENARILEKMLYDGALIELPGLTHYAYLEALPQVIKILEAFFNEKK